MVQPTLQQITNYCMRASVNTFLNLSTKTFHRTTNFAKILNRSTLKLRYSYMPNLNTKTDGYNKKNTQKRAASKKKKKKKKKLIMQLLEERKLPNKRGLSH